MKKYILEKEIILLSDIVKLVGPNATEAANEFLGGNCDFSLIHFDTFAKALEEVSDYSVQTLVNEITELYNLPEEEELSPEDVDNLYVQLAN